MVLPGGRTEASGGKKAAWARCRLASNETGALGFPLLWAAGRAPADVALSSGGGMAGEIRQQAVQFEA